MGQQSGSFNVGGALVVAPNANKKKNNKPLATLRVSDDPNILNPEQVPAGMPVPQGPHGPMVSTAPRPTNRPAVVTQTPKAPQVSYPKSPVGRGVGGSPVRGSHQLPGPGSYIPPIGSTPRPLQGKPDSGQQLLKNIVKERNDKIVRQQQQQQQQQFQGSPFQQMMQSPSNQQQAHRVRAQHQQQRPQVQNQHRRQQQQQQLLQQQQQQLPLPSDLDLTSLLSLDIDRQVTDNLSPFTDTIENLLSLGHCFCHHPRRRRRRHLCRSHPDDHLLQPSQRLRDHRQQARHHGPDFRVGLKLVGRISRDHNHSNHNNADNDNVYNNNNDNNNSIPRETSHQSLPGHRCGRAQPPPSHQVQREPRPAPEAQTAQ